MDTLPLPPRPDLAQYRKRAKELVKAAASGDVQAWANDWLGTLARLRGTIASPFIQASFDRVVGDVERRVEAEVGTLTLANSQLLIARAHGFATWGDFADQVERLSSSEGGDPFESAADAIVTGDLTTLTSLLRASPDLVQARSAREHRVTLLHYVAANGVEDFRQHTPPNAVAIATSLLDAGAEADAVAETYGGGSAQTTMNLLVSSWHPANAGLQPALVESLLDGGAAINGLDDDGSPLMTAVAFGYVDAAETLARRGARVDNVIAAAALGRVELVSELIAADDRMSPSLTELHWLGLSGDPESHRERALVWACAYGRTEVVEVLLAHGVDPAAKDHYGKTGLDWARSNGHDQVVDLMTAPRW